MQCWSDKCSHIFFWMGRFMEKSGKRRLPKTWALTTLLSDYIYIIYCFFVFFCFPVWSSFPCYLLHFGAKISDLQACCILERKSPIWMTTCLAFGFWLWLLGFGFLAFGFGFTWHLAFGFRWLLLPLVGFLALVSLGFWLLAFVVFCFWFPWPLYLIRTSVECMCSSIVVCI